MTSRTKPRILICEDEAVARRGVVRALGAAKYDFLECENGVKGLEALSHHHVDLVLLDLRMPVMDGATTLEHIREIASPPPVVVLTADTSLRSAIDAVKAGAEDYIAKPYDNAELQARINVGRRILSLQSKMREQEKLQGVLEMAGAVCHELNQPLQSVSGFSEMLLMDMKTGDPNADTLQKIKGGVDRIDQIVCQEGGPE